MRRDGSYGGDGLLGGDVLCSPETHRSSLEPKYQSMLQCQCVQLLQIYGCKLQSNEISAKTEHLFCANGSRLFTGIRSASLAVESPKRSQFSQAQMAGAASVNCNTLDAKLLNPMRASCWLSTQHSCRVAKTRFY